MHAARSLGSWKLRILPVFCHYCGVILGPDILAGPFSPDAPNPASFIALYSFLVDGFQHSINTPIRFWLGKLATGGCFWPGFFCCHCLETLVVSLSKCPALGTLLAVEKQRCGFWLLRTSFTQFWIYEVADEVASAFLTSWHCAGILHTGQHSRGVFSVDQLTQRGGTEHRSDAVPACRGCQLQAGGGEELLEAGLAGRGPRYTLHHFPRAERAAVSLQGELQGQLGAGVCSRLSERGPGTGMEETSLASEDTPVNHVKLWN